MGTLLDTMLSYFGRFILMYIAVIIYWCPKIVIDPGTADVPALTITLDKKTCRGQLL